MFYTSSLLLQCLVFGPPTDPFFHRQKFVYKEFLAGLLMEGSDVEKSDLGYLLKSRIEIGKNLELPPGFNQPHFR